MITKKKIIKKKITKKKQIKVLTKKEKVIEFFKIKKGKKEKIVKKIGKEKVPISKKNQLDQQNKTLINIFIIIGIIFVLILGVYFYTQSLIYFDYKGIEFQLVNEGSNENPLLFYQTLTLDVAFDGNPLGFRLRTKPSLLKKIDFENIEEFELTTLNGYVYEGEFNCEGDGVIAMANLQRLFERMGIKFLQDKNSACDSEGRYNFFTLKYGDKTEIKEISPKCYEIIIEGNNDECEILPATEKLMVEMFVKYIAL